MVVLIAIFTIGAVITDYRLFKNDIPNEIEICEEGIPTIGIIMNIGLRRHAKCSVRYKYRKSENEWGIGHEYITITGSKPIIGQPYLVMFLKNPTRQEDISKIFLKYPCYMIDSTKFNIL